MGERVLYGLEADGVGRERLVEVIAHLLTVVQDDVAQFQTDVPAPVNYPWPPDVKNAAATLLAASTQRRQQPGTAPLAGCARTSRSCGKRS